MKQSTIILFLFSLIIIPSQAQRGWRLFSEIGVGQVLVIHENSDGTLWVGGDGLLHYDGSGWESVAEFAERQLTGRVNAIHESRDGTLWVGGAAGLWG